MRLEVFCEDRLGLTRELLDLLVLRGIDLRGIEIDPIGRIYLNFAELEFESFSSLMAEIRRIAGVTDVRTVPWMPSEREHLALSALLEALPEPVLSVDMKSKVDMANPASCQLFGQKLDRLRNHTAAQLINGFNFLRWLESEPQDSHNEHVVINGQNFLMEITPVYLQDENDQHVLTGAVVMLRSTIRMGRQLQNVAAQDVSAFSQIVAVSPKMKHVVEQAQKLAMLSAPLLITGDTGTGKDLFAYACHQASPRAGKPYLALNCASIPEDAVESELFGHAPEGKKGFFEQANGGSVLLDEIGEMFHAGAAVHGVGLLHDYDVLAIVGKRTAQGEARRSEPDDRCVELFHGASFRRDPKGGRSIRGMLHAAEDVYRRAPDRPAGDGRRSARKRS